MIARLTPSLFFVAMGLLATAPARAADDANAQEQAALTAAVDRVAPSVVRIETVGGTERVGQMLFGTGPTTGLVVEPSGYIVTSAFNFVNKPTSILVRLADGTRKPAKLIATDHSRMFVLLKTDVDKPLTVCEIAPAAEMRVGQWAIAVGRAFDAERPSIAVGILSALDRIWGKAIQTDAATSPNNYGGPLVDIHGRVLGLVVPLSPETSDEIAGVEWYDSGIGFAIPAEQIYKVLPRLIKGEDLNPGVVGISLKATNIYTAPPIIGACRPKSPATAAGIKPGDEIVEIDDRPITRAAQVRQEISRRYAGDKMRVTVQRDKQRSSHDVELAAKLEPFQHGFLGILPKRSPDSEGVVVRYVYPDSPAAKAGIVAGDKIVSLQGSPIDSRAELMLKIGAIEPETQIELGVAHDKTVETRKTTLTTLPETLPANDVPSGHEDLAGGDEAERPKVGAFAMKVAEFPNEAWAYVPEAYDARASYGVVVWLHGAAGCDWQELLTRWKPLCDRYDLILVAPKSIDPARWMPGEAAFVDRLLGEVISGYNVDPARVVVHGYESGGTLAFLVGFRNRELIRAIAAVEAMPAGQLPENDPLGRLAIYCAAASKSRLARGVDSAIATLRKMKIPVVAKNLGDVPRYLNADELADLVRWIDTLDRI